MRHISPGVYCRETDFPKRQNRIKYNNIIRSNTFVNKKNRNKVDKENTNEENIYCNEYLTFHIIESGLITWKASDNCVNFKSIYYSKDNGDTWTKITSSRNGKSLIANSGEKILLKGNNTFYATNEPFDFNSFSTSSAIFDISGNILSLIYGDEFITHNEIETEYLFKNIFSNTNVKNAENLFLPSILTNGCYSSMFSGCKMLKTLPILSSKKMKHSCYSSMFSGCVSLTEIPNSYLLATELADCCYYFMFSGCTSLINMPQLPSLNLEYKCYCNMFNGCTSLTEIKDLPATTLSIGCYSCMWFDRRI